MGQKLVLQLALRQKPAAFGIRGTIEPEVVTNALNAVRLFGRSQILIVGGGQGGGWTHRKFDDNSESGDEPLLVKICEIIAAMQLEGEKIEVATTPNTPEEREEMGFCRIDLHLAK